MGHTSQRLQQTDLKEIPYSDIAEYFDTNITLIKTKINSLRTQFGKELTRERSTKSGQSTNELYSSKWAHFDKLAFLTPVFGASKSRDTLKRMSKMMKTTKRSHRIKAGRQSLKRSSIYSQNVRIPLPLMQSQNLMNLQTQNYLSLLFMSMRSYQS